jgi:putative ABC transport system permease protein
VWGPALVALVALLAMTLAHGLVTSVRARRGDLAILRALGFSRREIRRVVICEALTLASGGLLVGIPLGVAASSLAWLLYTRSLGIGASGTQPGGTLVAVLLGVLLTAGLIGVV